VSLRLRFWLISMVTLSGVVLTLSLSWWQLSRAHQKEAMMAAIVAQGQLAPVDSHTFATAANLSAFIHRVTKLRGSWVGTTTVFLDNRQMNAKPGFYVVTPLLIENSQQSVLVQRGWVARNFTDRTSLPTIPTPSGMVEIEGRIAPPPSKLYELGTAETGMIRQNLDVAAFRLETGLALLPVSILQTSGGNDGLLREWPVVASSASKNYGYAFQWAGLSLLITLLYVWFQIGKQFFSKRPA
jgi:surfeit locus 1 family protein